MAQEQQLPEIKLDVTQLYREEIFTDRKAGTLRRLVPVLADGNTDTARPVLYSGQTQLLTPAGVLPLAFELEAASLEDACNKFPDAVKIAIEQAIEEAREMRREAASRIVVPEGWHGCAAGGRAHQVRNGGRTTAVVKIAERVADCPVEEAHDVRVRVQAADVLADQAVLAAGIGHEVERLLQILQLLHERGAVREQHVVVGHAVHQQQRPRQPVRVLQHVAQRGSLRRSPRESTGSARCSACRRAPSR